MSDNKYFKDVIESYNAKFNNLKQLEQQLNQKLNENIDNQNNYDLNNGLKQIEDHLRQIDQISTDFQNYYKKTVIDLQSTFKKIQDISTQLNYKCFDTESYEVVKQRVDQMIQAEQNQAVTSSAKQKSTDNSIKWPKSRMPKVSNKAKRDLSAIEE